MRGNLAVSAFDGVAGEPSSLSACLKTKYTEELDQGVDFYKLNYDPVEANTKAAGTFNVVNIDCIANPPGGAHNSTLHQSGNFLAISNSSSDWAVDIIDIRNILTGRDPVHRWRFIDRSRQDTAGERSSKCPASATFECVVVKKPNGTPATELWRPHDLSFSLDGDTMYVAALNSTFVVNARNILNGGFQTLSIIPNVSQPNGLANPHNIELSHQADVTHDGKVLVITDERGGGVSNTNCNTDANGVIGGMHFWALGRMTGVPQSVGASPSNPKRLGAYFYPNPGLDPDVLQTRIDTVINTERGCTVHVFRIGGNGTAGPGPIQVPFDGVSRLNHRVLVTAWYGAGVWEVNFKRSTVRGDGIPENARSTWGNTIGWNVQPGADMWSAKEYKGHIFSGDLLRGFDVYGCAGTASNACPSDPVVALTKTGPATAARGSTVQYTVEAANAGPAASQNARVIDTLPQGLSFVSASGTGTYNATTQKVTWSLGTLTAGATRTVTLTARVASTAAVGTALVNRAEFTGDLTTANLASAVTVVK